MPGHNEALEKKIFGYYRDETNSLGKTTWALYNALTYWSTHESVRTSSEGNVASIVVEREARVRRTMNNNAFLAMAA